MKQQYNTYADQEKRVMEKHPELKAMRCISLDRASLDSDALSQFIEMCWTKDYGSENRIVFTPAFLNWSTGEAPRGKAVLTEEGKILGAVVYFQRKYEHRGRHIHYAIETGLSVHREYRGLGIAQWLSLKLKWALKEKNLDFSLVWYDTRHNTSSSSFQIFAMKKPNPHGLMPIRLMSRIFDYDNAVVNLPLNPVERMALKIRTGYDVRFPAAGLPAGFRIETFSSGRTDAYMEFLNRYRDKNGCKFIPTAEDLSRWRENTYGPAGFHALVHTGKNRRQRIEALYFGHKVRAAHGCRYFQADGILLCPDLEKRVARAFLRTVESRLCEEENCFCTIVPDTGGGRHLDRLGYRLLVHQHLGMESYRPSNTTLADLKQGWLELR